MSSTKKDLSVLFIIQAGKKFGIGHLKRALQIADFYTKPFIWVMTDLKDTTNLEKLLSDVPYQIIFHKDKSNLANMFLDYTFDLTVIDCVETSPSLIHAVSNCHIPIISLDNPRLGESSEIFIAPLPSYKQKNANFSQLHHMPIPEKFFLPQKELRIKKILITLGGSDPKNITDKIIKGLKDTPYEITVVQGSLNTCDFEADEKIKIVNNVDDMFPYIENHDLIFCGPGLTLLEAMAAKKYIVAVAHNFSQSRDLDSLTGIYTLKNNIFMNTTKIRQAVLNANIGKLSLPENFNFKDWWLNLGDSIIKRPAFCPLCNSYYKKALSRNSTQNHFLCLSCHSTYSYDIVPQISELDPDTLIASNPEHIQQSYKHSVLQEQEDSHRRIKIIKKILPTPSYHYTYKLIDIGTEHGVFVQEAAHNGFSAQGVELSNFARRLSEDKYNIEIFDSMEKLYATNPIYNVMTIWKKLELLPNPQNYIKRLSSLVCQGGLIAFRIPTVTNKPFSSGYFKITVEGGKALAVAAGLVNVYSQKYINSSKEEFLEFYCIKRTAE